MYPAMESGDHKGECDCVCVQCLLKMYPAMVSDDHEGECICVYVEYVHSFVIW